MAAERNLGREGKSCQCQRKKAADRTRRAAPGNRRNIATRNLNPPTSRATSRATSQASSITRTRIGRIRTIRSSTMIRTSNTSRAIRSTKRAQDLLPRRAAGKANKTKRRANSAARSRKTVGTCAYYPHKELRSRIEAESTNGGWRCRLPFFTGIDTFQGVERVKAWSNQSACLQRACRAHAVVTDPIFVEREWLKGSEAWRDVYVEALLN